MPLLHDIAHLAHAELLTPEPEKSLWFFTEILGLTENGRSGDSVYLRTWDDYEHHSLKLTAHTTSGLRRTGLRASSPEALKRRVADVDAAGLGIGWQEGDLGIGPTYLCRDPDGHEIELYYETEWFEATGAQKPALKNQAQARPTNAVSVRRLHDIGMNGWWVLLNLVPLGGLVLLVLFCQDSQAGNNRYGPNPKEVLAG